LLPVSPEAPSESSNLEQLIEVVRRRWRLLLGCIVLVTLASVGFSLLQQKQYTASSSLLFRDTQFDQELFGANFTPNNVDPAAQQATNIDLASLPIVEQRTAQALKGNGGVAGASISVGGVGQANIAQISVTDPDPVRAARIANTYAEQFVLVRQQADRSKIVAAQQLVNNELAALPSSQRYGSVGTTLQNRANQLGVLAALQTGNAEVAQPASVPTAPSTPDTKRNGALGLLLGLLLGMLLVFVSERLDRRIRGVAELEEAYGMPVLGMVPESRAYEAAGVTALPAVEAEAFALLRARLRYFNVDREIRSLLLTSSSPGEGKTTVALNLAIAEAFAGNEKVVLVEADLRRPSLSSRLDVSRDPGVAEILSRNATLETALQQISVPSRTGKSSASFSLIPAGAAPPNPAELMESRAMIDLLSALAERFDLVIIDTAPSTAVSDAIPLLRLVSGVIVVNRVDAITRDSAHNLRDHLRKLGAPVLGVVANAVAATGRYGYGYGYGYAEANEYLTSPETAEPESDQDATSQEAVHQGPAPREDSGAGSTGNA
jgi:capsular exopolysaccharide synthesis family protein